MLYVVVRQIEPMNGDVERDHRVFVLLEDAKRYYSDSERLCWDGPDGTSEENALLVTNCWLWHVHTHDPIAAFDMINGGKADLLSVCFPSDDK